MEAAPSVFPGRIRQFGFIVEDIDAAIAQWVALGVAPWLVMRDVVMEGCRYRGELSEPVISIALANSGDMQIELIQQHGGTPSIYQEFIKATGGGLNQVAYWVEDLDAVRAEAVAAGWTEVWRGPEDSPTGFSYLEHPDAPLAIVELMELNDGTSAMGSAIQAAAEAWTPGQPVFMS
jgi:Glyoxalase/Bleomycin resistance protein/Dioxygenase superfamily